MGLLRTLVMVHKRAWFALSRDEELTEWQEEQT